MEKMFEDCAIQPVANKDLKRMASGYGYSFVFVLFCLSANQNQKV